MRSSRGCEGRRTAQPGGGDGGAPARMKRARRSRYRGGRARAARLGRAQAAPPRPQPGGPACGPPSRRAARRRGRLARPNPSDCGRMGGVGRVADHPGSRLPSTFWLVGFGWAPRFERSRATRSSSLGATARAAGARFRPERAVQSQRRHYGPPASWSTPGAYVSVYGWSSLGEDLRQNQPPARGARGGGARPHRATCEERSVSPFGSARRHARIGVALVVTLQSRMALRTALRSALRTATLG
jgi:hypothetical protein